MKKCRKWTLDEIEEVIEYLEDNTRLEHPTAQVYYRKFLACSNLDATWSVVKFKVRYLKKKYKDAEKWRSSMGINLLQEDAHNGTSVVDEKLNKMCPFFYRLRGVFGPIKTEVVDESLDNADEITIKDDSSEEELTVCSPALTMEKVYVSNSSITDAIDDNAETSQTFFQSHITKNYKRSAREENALAMSTKQESRSVFLTKKLKFEELKFKQELLFEREKYAAEMEYKYKELELKEKQHRLELEKEERLAIYELELKYKLKSE